MGNGELSEARNWGCSGVNTIRDYFNCVMSTLFGDSSEIADRSIPSGFDWMLWTRHLVRP